MSKLIIHLNQDLNIYFQESDQGQIKKDLGPKLVYSLVRSGKILNLHQSFEEIWKEIDSKHNFDKLLLIFGERAGFGDSRIIYIWAKSWQLFNPQKTLQTKQIVGELTLEDFDFEFEAELQTNLPNSQGQQDAEQVLFYNAPPRIG